MLRRHGPRRRLALLVLTVFAILAVTLFGYLRKVSAPRYPKS
jgi:hypothetical protein